MLQVKAPEDAPLRLFSNSCTTGNGPALEVQSTRITDGARGAPNWRPANRGACWPQGLVRREQKFLSDQVLVHFRY